MNLLSQELASQRAIEQSPPSDTDSLIAHGLQKEQYVGIFALAIALIAAVGFLSPRVEYAIVFAIVLSGILIAFFLFV